MLRIGIVGLPNVGKSTLFNALTNMRVPAENYPFCTIEPSVGVVGVPDERLHKLATLSQSAKIVPAAIEFVDIAGLVKGAAEGQGLGNQFLRHIRDTDAIVQVVRFFDDSEVLHIDGRVDPSKDIEIINLELILSDVEQIKKRKNTIAGELKSAKKDAVAEDIVLTKLELAFSTGKLALHAGLTADEHARVKHLNLLTMKPMLYVLNRKTGGKNLNEISDERAKRAHELIASFTGHSVGHFVYVDAATELDMSDLIQGDRASMRQELGLSEDGLANLIRSTYGMLGLISFFTTGKDETRAWTVVGGSTAPIAGRVIHTDFFDKFIRAEVVSYSDLIAVGGWSAVREQGKLRTEGKDYIIKDGDVIVFLHGG